MNLTDILSKRYSTKSFDPKRKIDEKTWLQVEDALRLSASSTNAQPWHFVVAHTDEGKKRLTMGTKAYAFNTEKILNASHGVLFCARTSLEEDYLRHVLDTEDQAGRFPDTEVKEKVHSTRKFFVDIHANELNDLQHWNEKQVYLNIGSVLLGASVLGIDAVPMEGIDIPALNKEFNLAAKGMTAVVMVAFGYRAEDDFNAKLPKSRLLSSEIITRV